MLTSYATPRTGERFMHGIEEYLVAGAIVLEMVWAQNEFTRSLVVEKMRCTNVKPAQIEFEIIKGQGVVLDA
jgi:KaiC/GvpD/RAD55 family RecA-like ATPase